jgi:hypothetical protein
LQVVGDDQAGDPAAPGAGCGHGLGDVAGEAAGRGRPAGEAAGPGGQQLDVAGERRVGGEVPGGVLADQVDDRRERAPRVVQVGEAVGEARAEMEEGERRLFGDAGIAVGGTGADVLVQREDRPHAGHGIERVDQRHLGGARIGEADLEAERCRCLDQSFRTVHAVRNHKDFQNEQTILPRV